MSSSNPPYPNFNGITYNSSFFPTTTSGLTQTQANLLYLRKTVADTAIAAETFSGGITVSTLANINPLLNAAGGIASSNYDSSGASVVINLGTAQTTGVLNIGTGNRTTSLAGGGINIGSSLGTNPIVIDTSSTLNSNATPAISIGASTSNKTIKINNGTNSVHCSSIDLKGSTINHITANSPAGIIIGDGQTDSTVGLLIGCSSSGTVRTTAPIKIGNDSTFTGSITIGGSSTNINMNGSTTIGSLRTGSIDNAGALVIGATATPLTIGNASSANSILGTTTIANLAINTVDRSSIGQLSIAPTTATSLVLGNLTTCNTTNLGTFTSTGGIIANGSITSTSFNGLTATGEVYLGSSQISATGGINIGTGLLRSSAINIGTGNASVIGIGGTGLTTIGSGGLQCNGTIKTAYVDSLTAASTLELGNSNAADIYLGSSGVAGRNVAIRIGIGAGTGSTTIGNSTNTVTLGGATTSTGILTVNNIFKVLCSSTLFSVGRPADNAFWISSNNYVNGVYLAGASSAGWVNVSDITMKENITPMVNMLDKINELKPCQYNYIGNQDELCMGFIAQELQNQFPNLIYKSNEKLGIAYTGLIPVIIKALQEQQEQINSLKDELKLLSAKIA